MICEWIIQISFVNWTDVTEYWLKIRFLLQSSLEDLYYSTFMGLFCVILDMSHVDLDDGKVK